MVPAAVGCSGGKQVRADTWRTYQEICQTGVAAFAATTYGTKLTCSDGAVYFVYS